MKLQIDWGISPFGCYGMNGAKILKWDNLGQIETKFVCKLIVPGVQNLSLYIYTLFIYRVISTLCVWKFMIKMLVSQ